MQKGGRSPSFFNAHFLNQISHICNERKYFQKNLRKEKSSINYSFLIMKNEFVLQGFIVFENLAETRGNIMIKPGGFQDTVDAPMVLLTGNVFQQYKDGQFRKGLYVKATIKIQSYVNDVRNEDGSTGKRYHQESFVQTLERVDPIPGDFDELSRFPNPINRGVLEGELVNIYRLSGNIVRMTILTIIDDRRSYVTCYRNMPNAQRVVDKLRVGDQLHLECYLTNQQKEHDGKIVHYQDVMIDRITIM